MRLRFQFFRHLSCLVLNRDEYSFLDLQFCVSLETALGFGLFKYTVFSSLLVSWSYHVGLGKSPLSRCDPAGSPVLITSNITLTFKDFTSYLPFTHHTCLGEDGFPSSSLRWQCHCNCLGASSWCLQHHSSPHQELMSIRCLFEKSPLLRSQEKSLWAAGVASWSIIQHFFVCCFNVLICSAQDQEVWGPRPCLKTQNASVIKIPRIIYSNLHPAKNRCAEVGRRKEGKEPR